MQTKSKTKRVFALCAVGQLNLLRVHILCYAFCLQRPARVLPGVPSVFPLGSVVACSTFVAYGVLEL